MDLDLRGDKLLTGPLVKRIKTQHGKSARKGVGKMRLKGPGEALKLILTAVGSLL